MLAQVEIPADAQLHSPASLEFVTSAGRLALETTVVGLLPGYGVVLAFPKERAGEVEALIADAPTAAPPRHELVAAEAIEPPAAPPTGADAEAANTAEKIRLALHGTRDERASVLRDRNRSLHQYVLKNPRVTADEIESFAKNAQMSGEFLKLIAERKEWMGRSGIATALARNPKTPPDIAVRALDFCGNDTLRQMAKGAGLPHVVAAARKKVIGS